MYYLMSNMFGKKAAPIDKDSGQPLPPHFNLWRDGTEFVRPSFPATCLTPPPPW
jgi:hypothetical protein